MKKITIPILFLLCFAGGAFAQSSIVPVGGDARNNNGSVSYTVGQIAVQRATSNGDPLPCWKVFSNHTRS